VVKVTKPFIDSISSQKYPWTVQNGRYGPTVPGSPIFPESSGSFPPGSNVHLGINHLFNLSTLGQLERMEPETCIHSYARQYQSTRGGVILVTETSNVSAILAVTPGGDGDWTCVNTDSPFCEVAREDNQWRKDPSRQTVLSGAPVSYCLSERPRDQCKVWSSIHMTTIVIILNLVKLTAMFSLSIWIKDRPMMTIGDAIASYLERPDPNTEKMCLVTKSEGEGSMGQFWLKGPRKFDGRRRRLGRAIYAHYLVACVLLYVDLPILLLTRISFAATDAYNANF